MNYWLCITNERNWKVIEEKNVWGVSEGHKSKLNMIEVNDLFTFYLKQEKVEDKMLTPGISGVFRAISKPFKDEEKIFSSAGFREEMFSY